MPIDRQNGARANEMMARAPFEARVLIYFVLIAS